MQTQQKPPESLTFPDLHGAASLESLLTRGVPPVSEMSKGSRPSAPLTLPEKARFWPPASSSCVDAETKNHERC